MVIMAKTSLVALWRRIVFNGGITKLLYINVQRRNTSAFCFYSVGIILRNNWQMRGLLKFNKDRHMVRYITGNVETGGVFVKGNNSFFDNLELSGFVKNIIEFGGQAIAVDAGHFQGGFLIY